MTRNDCIEVMAQITNLIALSCGSIGTSEEQDDAIIENLLAVYDIVFGKFFTPEEIGNLFIEQINQQRDEIWKQ